MQPHFNMPKTRPHNSPVHYGRAAMLLHWSIAALVLFEFASALSFSRFNPGDAVYFHGAYRAHMSAGMALLAMSALCVAWRLLHKYPALVPDMRVATRFLARCVHILLYAFIVAVPATGWAILSARHAPTAIFGKLDWPKIAYVAQLPYEQRSHLNDFLLDMHDKLSYLGVSLVGLHVAASLYHHFWRGDEVLTCMLPGFRTKH